MTEPEKTTKKEQEEAPKNFDPAKQAEKEIEKQEDIA